MQLLLARQDIDPNTETIDGHSPLAAAAPSGHEEIVRLLISRDDVKPTFSHKYCPIGLAVYSGQARVLELLLQRYNVNLNDCRRSDRSLLWWGAHLGHKAVVRVLLARDDVDPNHYDHDGTALFVAIAGSHHAVAELLLAREDLDPNRGTMLTTPLECALQRGDVAMVRSLLRRQDVKPNMILSNSSPL